MVYYESLFDAMHGYIIIPVFIAVWFLVSALTTIKVRKYLKKREAERNDDSLSPNRETLSENFSSRDKSYISENGIFIQNNNMAIQQRVSELTPFFYYERLINEAKRKFEALVNRELTADSLDTAYIPYVISGFGDCFLHNYILQDKTESIKVFINVKTEGGDQDFFMIFSRSNPHIHVNGGSLVSLSCPHCGGEDIKFSRGEILCPFCKKRIKFNTEWKLTDAEWITENSLIDKRAVISSY